MKKITVNVSKQYDIYVGENLIQQLDVLLNGITTSKRIAVITDDIVDALYSDIVIKQLENQEYEVYKFVFKNGEESKNKDTLFDILSFLADHHFNRKDSLIALGGGVVGDITGLAASLYMRGIKFIQIPTTLLSMVDASIGGKTAIDLEEGKNLVGSFYQPSLVICDIEIIKKLPKPIFTEGMGEVIKYNLIKDIGVFDAVLNNTLNQQLEKIIIDCIEIKREIVEQDEFETKQIREVLNIGHTFAHGIEKLSNYRIQHGYAVAMGMIYETALSYKLNLCSLVFFKLLKNVIEKCGLYLNIEYSLEDLIEAMKLDKKNSGSSAITFVLVEKCGQYKRTQLAKEEIINLLRGESLV